MHQVLELAHVARPVIAIEARDAVPVEASARPAVARAEHVDEVAGEQTRIAGALAQRRQPEEQDLEPVVEIRPELLGEHQLPQVHVGRGDDPDIRVLLALPAERPIAEVLQESQQRHLSPGAQRLHFVQEQRPAVGQRDQAGLWRRARRCTRRGRARTARSRSVVPEARRSSPPRTGGPAAHRSSGWRVPPLPFRFRSHPRSAPAHRSRRCAESARRRPEMPASSQSGCRW